MNFKDFSLDLIDLNPCKITFVALGNELRGDDGISYYFLEKLKETNLFKDSAFLSVGTNPENYLDKIIEKDPELVIFIDAAEFNGSPGKISWLDGKEVNKIDISTHAFSIKLVEDFLRAEKEMEFKYLGIQTISMKFDENISKELLDCVDAFFNT